MNIDQLRNRSKTLLEEITFQLARIMVNSGVKTPVYAPYRYQLGAKLRYGSERTVSRIVKELADDGWLIRLPQRKDRSKGIYGPIRLCAAKKLWSRLKRMVRTITAEDNRKRGFGIKTRRPKSTTISYSLKSQRGARVERERAEVEQMEQRQPGESLTQYFARHQAGKKVAESV